MIRQMEALLPGLDALIKEFKPNGGASIRDQLNRIEREVQLARSMASIGLRMADRAYWVSDTDGFCIEASPGLAKLQGRMPEQILGNGWVTSLPPQWREPVAEEWKAAVQEQREFDMEYAFRQPNGTIVPVTGHAIPVRVSGKVVGYVGWAVPIAPPLLPAGGTG
jgi:PAS domain S-box-containing protein